MVFKFLQEFPLSLKGLILQAILALIIWFFVFTSGLSQGAFFAGLVFSHIYILLFFYSGFFLIKKKRRTLALFLLFFKWIFLFFVLIFANWFLKDKAWGFLLGLSSLLTFLFLYVWEVLRSS